MEGLGDARIFAARDGWGDANNGARVTVAPCADAHIPARDPLDLACGFAKGHGVGPWCKLARKAAVDDGLDRLGCDCIRGSGDGVGNDLDRGSRVLKDRGIGGRLVDGEGGDGCRGRGQQVSADAADEDRVVFTHGVDTCRRIIRRLGTAGRLGALRERGDGAGSGGEGRANDHFSGC